MPDRVCNPVRIVTWEPVVALRTGLQTPSGSGESPLRSFWQVRRNIPAGCRSRWSARPGATGMAQDCRALEGAPTVFLIPEIA